MESLILALDFGGTKLSAGLARSDSAAWLALDRALTSEAGSAAEDLSIMDGWMRAWLEKYPISTLGVSFGGPVDFSSGTVRLSHHVPGWESFPLKQYLEKTYGLPCVVDNDANAAALGEQRLGAGSGCDDLLYITVSTGVGGGWILRGEPWRGANGMAGEIGHMVVDPDGPPCLCGKRGCLERLASGSYMGRDYGERRAAAAGGQTGPAGFSGKDVADLAQQGEPIARRILLRGARALGTAIGNAANLVNPQRFILGGGVTRAGESWWQAVDSAARETALPEVRDSFAIVPAALGDDAPLWGAVCLAKECLGSAFRQDTPGSLESVN